MKNFKFVALLKDLGIKIYQEDNLLRYRAPKGVMTSDLKQELLERKTEIIEFLQQAKKSYSLNYRPIIRLNKHDNLPLSLPQQRLWFLHQLDSQNPFYNESCQFRIIGLLNVAALEQSINEIIRRHEALRTTFPTVEGLPVQRIISSLTINLPVVDLQGLKEAEVQQIIIQEVCQPFDLSKLPLLRVSLLRLGSEFHLLILTIHHIVIDGWSMGIFLEELSALYQAFSIGSPTPLPDLTIQYGDFTVWQRQWLTKELQQKQLNYWKQQLGDAPRLLELPTDYPRPSVQSFSGATKNFQINSNLTAKLKIISQQSGTTLFVTVLAAFSLLLHRYSGQNDICIGSPFANRNQTEIEGLIGFFVNTLVLRTQIKENPTFLEFVTQVQQVVLDAYAHQDVPFNQVVEALQPERSLSYNPLSQVMFVLENFALDAVELPGITLTPELVERGTAQCDLSLSLWQTKTGLLGSWEYNTDLFKADTIARMAGHFQTLLEAIAANPAQSISELPLLTETERHQLLVEWNNTEAEYPFDRCIHQLFEEQVERTPDAVAVVFEGEQLTYRELNAKANQLAHYLRSLGVRPEVLVGICVERSFETIVGILGILKAGGAYVPIDPGYPSERIACILHDSQLPVLLTQKQLVASLSEHQARVVCLDADWEEISVMPELPPKSDVAPENLAYVIYTSGSTGKPKGVLIAHRGLCNLAQAQIKLFDVQPDSRVLQFASISFDASVSEIVMAVCTGATLCLGTAESLQPGQPLVRLLQQHSITHLTLVPSALAVLPHEELPALQTIVVAGEACPTSLLAQWAEGRRFFNAYGPTESTVCATVFQCFEGMDVLPIGRPIDNTQVYILDRYLQPVPIGVPGELHIASVGLARGYLNRPDLTDEKFIPNPFSNKQGLSLYKTGDKARYLPDGNIEFLGRIDNQVKIRGFRIELGEIEAALGQHPDVKEVAVICREDTPGKKRLVAYLVSNLIPDRIPYHSECQLELDDRAIQIHTEDISTGGFALIGVPAIKQGKSIRLHLQLPGESFPRWLSGTVAWSHPPQAGVCFHLTPNEQVLIDQCLAYLLDIQGLWKTLQRTVTRNLRDYLKQKLPDYMIPSAFVLMKALPLTPNGKVDRRALPALDNFHKELENKFIAPRTPTETKLAAIWAEVLAVQQVNLDDNFFEVGGHSLLATQIISRIRQTFSIELKVRHVFEFPTIASLSQVIDTASSMQSQEQSSKSMAFDAYPPLVPVKRDTRIPLSFTQESIWNFQQFYAESFAYNSPVGLRFTGQISPEILEKSINEIIRRHEILRTNFTVVESQPVQAIAPELTLPLEIVDLQNLSPVEREAKAQQLAVREFQHQFDLESEPLIKITLLQLSVEEYWLIITMHHIITDGWSYGIFFQELQTLYHAFSNGLSSPLPHVPLQYADFTIWERQWLTEEVVQKQLEYWLQKLADIPPSLNFLPMEEVEPSSSIKRASLYSLLLPESQVASIKALSRSRGVTVFAILIAALKILLYKWSGNPDIIVLATTANRQTPDIEKMLGCFINDVFVRSYLDDYQTGIMLLDSVNQTVSEALVNQAIPLQKIVETLGKINPINSLRSVSVSMEPPTIWQNSTLHYKVASIPLEGELWDEQHCPLELHLRFQEEHSNSIEIVGFYSTVAFTFETIERLFSDYREILYKLIDCPEMKIAAFESDFKNDREGVK